MPFTVQQFDSAVQKFLEHNPKYAVRYNSASLAKAISDRMQQTSLPTVIAARIALDALVREGKIVRTDDHDAAWDADQDYKLAEQTLNTLIQQIQSVPPTKDFIEYCASLDPRTLSAMYFNPSDDNVFRYQYDVLVASYGFRPAVSYAQVR